MLGTERVLHRKLFMKKVEDSGEKKKCKTELW